MNNYILDIVVILEDKISRSILYVLFVTGRKFVVNLFLLFSNVKWNYDNVKYLLNKGFSFQTISYSLNEFLFEHLSCNHTLLHFYPRYFLQFLFLVYF